jgi:hypothetical protein
VTKDDRKPQVEEKGDRQFLISLANLPQDVKETEFQATIKDLGIQFTACKVTSVEGSNPTAIIWFKTHDACKYSKPDAGFCDLVLTVLRQLERQPNCWTRARLKTKSSSAWCRPLRPLTRKPSTRKRASSPRTFPSRFQRRTFSALSRPSEPFLRVK